MKDKSQEEVLPGPLKKLYSGRKRRINMEHWKVMKRKKLKDAGKTHETWKGKQIDAKYPSKQVSGIML
jgi:hypothetical protein